MNWWNKFKVAAAIIGSVCSVTPAVSAQSVARPKAKITHVVSDAREPMSQFYVEDGQLKFMYEDSGDHNFGAELDNEDININLSTRGDQGRIRAYGKSSTSWLGVEYSWLDSGNRVGLIGGHRFGSHDIEGIVDSDGNWSTVLFSQVGPKRLLGTGAHQNNGVLEGNVVYCHEFDDYGARWSIRLAEGGFVDARVLAGTNITYQKARAFGIRGNTFNNISGLDTVRPLWLDGFFYNSADAACGTGTGDMGIDLRHMKNRSYAQLAYNTGDHGFFQDLIVTPELHHANNRTGAQLGLSSVLGGDAKLWYQGTFDPGEKPDHAVLMQHGISF